MADSSADVCDVCIVGVGGMGGIMAKELASAGLKVVGFERGPAPKKEDYAPRDSIRFLIRPEQLEWVRHEPTTTRKKAGQKTNLQYRTSPLNVLGGALLHWTGAHSRRLAGRSEFGGLIGGTFRCLKRRLRLHRAAPISGRDSKEQRA